MINKIKNLISLDNPFRLIYHKIRAILANIIYRFPSKGMIVVWVTGTNGKTTTCNIIAKWLQKAWKKVFMFSTVNILINGNEYRNDTKMTSPDAFELQRLLRIAKKEWCEVAVIETASHGIKMHRSNWEKDELLKNIEDTINDIEISNNLKKASDFMQSDNGAEKAAALIVDLN